MDNSQIYEEGCALNGLNWTRHCWRIPSGWKWHIETWTDPNCLDGDELGVTDTRDHANALSEAALYRLLKEV